MQKKKTRNFPRGCNVRADSNCRDLTVGWASYGYVVDIALEWVADFIELLLWKVLF